MSGYRAKPMLRFCENLPTPLRGFFMTWHLRLLFLAAAALLIWGGFIRKKVLYPIAEVRPKTRMLVWLGRIVTGILAAFPVWEAFPK